VEVHVGGVTSVDPGVGMAPKQLAQMYQPFVRGAGSRRPFTPPVPVLHAGFTPTQTTCGHPIPRVRCR
jgi:hypothetical protein